MYRRTGPPGTPSAAAGRCWRSPPPIEDAGVRSRVPRRPTTCPSCSKFAATADPRRTSADRHRVGVPGRRRVARRWPDASHPMVHRGGDLRDTARCHQLPGSASGTTPIVGGRPRKPLVATVYLDRPTQARRGPDLGRLGLVEVFIGMPPVVVAIMVVGLVAAIATFRMAGPTLVAALRVWLLSIGSRCSFRQLAGDHGP